MGQPGEYAALVGMVGVRFPVGVWVDLIVYLNNNYPEEYGMARLTVTKMAKWEADALKARSLINGILTQQRELLATARGGRYQDLVNCIDLTKEAYASVDAVRGSSVIIQQGEARRANPKVTL